MPMHWNTLHGTAPRIIAHRGASGYRPEHTREAYELALAQGADVVEPDLVMSRDGVLFVRHEAGLAHSTDIAARAPFAARARDLGGHRDWWISDLDAAEVETLRAVQPIASRGTQYDGLSPILRFGALLDLVAAGARQRGTPVCVDVEMKDPEFFGRCGLDMPAAVVRELEARGLTGASAPVWLESFDHAALGAAFRRSGNRSFALFEHAPAAVALRELAAWVSGVAPHKSLLWDHAGHDSGLVAAAHALGLEVHSWTFREDRSPAPFASTRAELEAAFALGVDALFCDFPDVAVTARARYGA